MKALRALLAAASLASLAACGVSPYEPAPTLSPAPTPGPAPTAPASEYSREAFLPDGWPNDPNRPGRDLRHELLYERSMTTPILHEGMVEWGVWHDPYVDEKVYAPDVLEIDHVFALRDAWDSGADGWTPELRLRFATDPRNLVPTQLNSEKQDSAPGEWDDPLLSPIGRCFNARRYLDLSREYSLTLLPEQQERVYSIIANCPPGPYYASLEG